LYKTFVQQILLRVDVSFRALGSFLMCQRSRCEITDCLCVSSCTIFIPAVSSVPWGEYRIKQRIFIIGRAQREVVTITGFLVRFSQSSEVVCECKSDLTSRIVTRWSGRVRRLVVGSPKAVRWIFPNSVSDNVRILELLSSRHRWVTCCSVYSQLTMMS
jgi:hypothetical protein